MVSHLLSRGSLTLSAALAVLFAASAAGAEQGASPDTLRLGPHDAVTLAQAGASAAFSVDPTIAEASARDGKVTITARSVGATTVSIVTPQQILTIPIEVVEPPRSSQAGPDQDGRLRWTRWEGRYETAGSRLTDSIEMRNDGDDTSYRAYAVNVTRLGDLESDLDARTSMPAMSLALRDRHGQVVLLDQTVDHSPLTLDGTTVRGMHLGAGGLAVHAGVTSPLLYQSVFLSTQREIVVGGSYKVKAGRSSFTPNLYHYPSESQSGGSSGTMGSLLYAYASADERLHVLGEAGWGGEPGAAADISYQAKKHRVWAAARHQPRGFAAVGIGRPLGSSAESLWTSQLAERFTLNLAGSAARHEFGDIRQETATGTLDARARVTDKISVSSGAAVGRFKVDASPRAVRTFMIPTGAHLDLGRLAASGVYRYQRNSANNTGGHGGRLSLRANRGSLHASSFVDAQQEAATVDLILRNEPALARLLNELGLTANTPDALANLLRDDAILAQLGYVEGTSLNFNPWRAQVGADLAWLAADEDQLKIRLHLLYDRTRTFDELQDTKTAALIASRRITDAVEVMGAANWWSRDSGSNAGADQWALAIGCRVRIDDVPRWPSRRGDIHGVVVDQSANGAPMAGVVVRLDGQEEATTDASGRFVFEGVEGGEHRIDADPPDGAYFASFSSATARPGESVRFRMARSSAYLTGMVRDDVGNGLGGVVVRLHGTEVEQTARTDSTGHFRFVVAGEGQRVLEVQADSVPAEHDLSEAGPQTIVVSRATPVRVQIAIAANRSIAGAVRGETGAGATVRIVELGRQAPIGPDGSYVFRKLMPGTYTLEAGVGGRIVSRRVEIPAGPASVRGIDFDL